MCFDVTRGLSFGTVLAQGHAKKITRIEAVVVEIPLFENWVRIWRADALIVFICAPVNFVKTAVKCTGVRRKTEAKIGCLFWTQTKGQKVCLFWMQVWHKYRPN